MRIRPYCTLDDTAPANALHERSRLSCYIADMPLEERTDMSSPATIVTTMTRFLMISAFTLLAGCAGYSGAGLKPGIATVTDVEASMGTPAMVWKNPQGQVIQLAYPRGPAGYVSFMAHFNDQGKLEKIEQVLDERHFAQLKAGMTQADVLRILGPYRDTNVFPARDELDWNYGYCSQNLQRMAYSVMFDTRTSLVTGGQTNPDPLFPGGKMYAQPCIPWTGN